ncbi:MAG: carboxypeptidase regulatory-like domain-containing protein [Acidobacteria bacterium]|nr:carboxypeptidase regulatory-like domain-containing protein [Acidobacteriota bacterium]
MNLQKTERYLLILAIGAFLICGIFPGRQAAAQVPEANLQRSTEIYNLNTTAPDGAQRGEELYYYKCWMCHNAYSVEAGTPATLLKDLYQRSVLMSGQPVNDETVAEKIRNGGPGMPGYRYSLSDRDIADLLSYIRDGECCFEGEEPPANPRYRGVSGPNAALEGRNNLGGGPVGLVRNTDGEPLEGILVQLIAEQSAIRTTVYSDETGRYEFPKLPPGQYTLRIARPLEFRPYQRNSVRIDGDVRTMDEIVLERVTESELLPPTMEIASQLSGAEWILNLPSTGQEKAVFKGACGFGCHSYQQIFRNRFDEHSWRLLVRRMIRYRGSPLIHSADSGRGADAGKRPGRSGFSVQVEEDVIAPWLARVRGPDSEDMPFQVLPGPRGAATRAIVTEYELPRMLLAPHDVGGDSQGNIWYTPHRSPYVGKLDPRTGIVTEYRVPKTPGVLPGTHSVWVDKNDIVWLSENWAHTLTKFDPRTEKFTQVRLDFGRRLNTPAFGNFALAPDGQVWVARGNAILKIHPETGEFLERYPLEKIGSTYGNMVSADNKFWAGGLTRGNWLAFLDIQKGTVVEMETRFRGSRPAKGYFDPDGNAWMGGRGGVLIKVDIQARRIQEFVPPTPFVTFYEAMTDHNGEVWAGEMQGGRFVRFNPATEKWIEYVLPEPFAHNRRTWVDNSTTPVTVWYVDHNGYMVRLQPLE